MRQRNLLLLLRIMQCTYVGAGGLYKGKGWFGRAFLLEAEGSAATAAARRRQEGCRGAACCCLLRLACCLIGPSSAAGTTALISCRSALLLRQTRGHAALARVVPGALAALFGACAGKQQAAVCFVDHPR